MATAIGTDPNEFRNHDFDLSYSNEENSASKSVKIPDMSRLSTPKPIMHLGSSTEVKQAIIYIFNNESYYSVFCSFNDKGRENQKLLISQEQDTDLEQALNQLQTLKIRELGLSLEQVFDQVRELIL